MPTQEFPAQIRLPVKQAASSNYFHRSTLANAQILEFLLPQLAISCAKQTRMLVNADDYMLQETQELYIRVEGLCQRLNIHNSLDIHLNIHDGQIEVIGNIPDAQALQQIIHIEPWLPGAFRWLHPNYLMLAQSLELLEFSRAYEHSTTLALAKYQHLALPENGMTCYLRLEEGKINLIVESALHLYQLKINSEVTKQ